MPWEEHGKSALLLPVPYPCVCKSVLLHKGCCLSVHADVVSTALKKPSFVVVLVLCVALVRAEIISEQADIVAALTVDVLHGTVRAYDQGRDSAPCVCV